MGFDLDLESEEEVEQRPMKRRVWDDDVVLKRQFSALIPAFDPRPGRNNVAHTTDIEIPTPGEKPLFIIIVIPRTQESGEQWSHG